MNPSLPAKPDPSRQLLTCKFLFSQGRRYQDTPTTAWRTGLAISLYQDAVELMIRLSAGEAGIRVSEKDGFVSLLNKLGESRHVPSIPQLHELNKARVGFKHYGILPAVQEGARLGQYAESFLVWAADTILRIDFREFSIVSLVDDEEIRCHLQVAEQELAGSEFPDSEVDGKECISRAVEALARAYWLIGHRLAAELPEVDLGAFQASEIRRSRANAGLFGIVGAHLQAQRAFMTGIAFGQSSEDRHKLRRILPTTHRTLRGQFGYTRQGWNETNPSTADVQACISIVVDMATNGRM